MIRGLALSLSCASLAWAQAPGHAPIQLFDRNGQSVLETQEPVSTQRTCAPCHDVDLIAQGYHAQLGFDERGPAPSGRGGDVGPGPAGRWDAIHYLPPAGAQDPSSWLRANAWRHVGGGPGQGTLEVDCFLCHTPQPDLARRRAAVEGGHFADAPTASLTSTGLVAGRPGAWRWSAEGFDAGGRASPALLGLEAPRDGRCLGCHGLPSSPAGEPVWAQLPAEPDAVGDDGWVFSGQRVSDSAFNLAGKAQLTRPWDAHAARLVGCTDCHPALNAPGSFTEADGTRPAHLARSPRGPAVSEFVQRPSHDFRKGFASQGTVARRLSGSMRDCRDCHAAQQVHETWLPFAQRHLERVSCQACHIPRSLLPARRATDWSVPSPDWRARVELRGADGPPEQAATLLVGWEPLLVERVGEPEQPARLQPVNLHTVFYWVGGNPAVPVPRATLTAALHEGEGFRADVLAGLDRDGDGRLTDDERWLDEPDRVELVRARLEAAGVEAPRLVGELQAQELHHGVVGGSYALRDCQACHTGEGRLGRDWELAARAPAGVVPALVGDARVRLGGEVVARRGGLVYAPRVERHVVGHTRRGWVDPLGLGLLVLTGLGVAGHAGLRVAGRRRP